MVKPVTDRAIARSAVLVLTCAAPALGGYTRVFPGNEPGHEKILEGLYLGDFTLSGESYVGGGPDGGVNAVRVDDWLSPFRAMNVVAGRPGDAPDQLWTDGAFDAVARARFAARSQQFGFDRGRGFEPLFDVQGTDFNVTGSARADLRGDVWAWTRRDSGGTNAFSSFNRANPGFLDHMVAYRVEGATLTGPAWLLFWEDLGGRHYSRGGRSDRDFNDLVVEIRTIPEPASAALLAALSAWAILAARRRWQVWPRRV